MAAPHVSLSDEPDPELSAELCGIAKGAARNVGWFVYSGFTEGVEVERKSSFHDVVTQYDREAERRIIDYIFDYYGDSRICGEEGGVHGSGAVEWYIDPIDGTNNFASGIPFFCISIAAKVGEKMAAGVVYDPVRDEMFSASRTVADVNGSPMKSSGGSRDEQCTLVTSLPKPQAWDGLPRGLSSELELYATLINRFRTVRRLGSCALSLAYVAAGRIDVVFNVGVNSWDVAAGMLLVERAGGRYFPLAREGDGQAEPWRVPSFIAHVGSFELEQSCLNQLVRS